MNRVCLSGWFAQRPTLSYGPCGAACVELLLIVPRSPPQGVRAQGSTAPDADLVPCVATGTLAVAVYTWGEPQVRVELEGRLVAPVRQRDLSPHGGKGPLPTVSMGVRADHARVLDDPLGCLDPEGPRDVGPLVLLVPTAPDPATEAPPRYGAGEAPRGIP